VPSTEQVAEAHYRRQQALANRASKRLTRLWRQVDRDNILPSWRRQIGDAFAVLSTAQAIAAASSGVYVDDALEAQGHTVDAEGRVSPAGFAGVASDGRSLATLLEQPALRALGAIAAGSPTPRAMAAGLLELDMITRTQVADAGRTADGVAITARPEVAGYTRVLVGKSCSRCVILAGRWYRWNTGFKRHPRCDCRHVPTMEDMSGDVRTGPRAYFDSLSADEQDKTFGKAGAQAVRDGAELSQVVNARRGMQTASVFGRDVLLTTEGTTTRGLAGQRLGARRSGVKRDGGRYRSAVRVRLMPEQIYAEANGDRTEAIRLLKLHGYLL
jgi:hypothetical protein